MIKLIRDNDSTENSTVLSGTEFVNAVLDQISSTVQKIKTNSESEEIVNDVSDVLELVNVYLIAQNIKPSVVLETASAIRQNMGSFSKKLSVQENENGSS